MPRQRDGQPSRPAGYRRAVLIAAVVVGLGLAIAPLGFQMFQRAPKGADMLAEFKPFMTSQRLDGFQREIGQIRAAVHEVDHKAAPRLRTHDAAQAKHALTDYRDLHQQWPSIDATMSDLLDKVQGSLGDYQAMAALPSFRLFPWFFAIPGLLITAAAGAALAGGGWARPAGAAIALIGLALVLAPVGFQMFSRAPKGAHMMATFRHIETTENVARIQGYFSTMAVGQGAIRNSVVPALQHTGLTGKQLERQFPAITTLDRQWVHTLNDMTPMIGAMSDGEPRYEAISSLPSFTLFPWFFVIPGALFLTVGTITARKGVS